MAEPKTRPTGASVTAFIDAVPDEGKRKDAKTLLKCFRSITGENAVMWGPSIVGFGTYPTASGTWPRTGFSPRKADLVLYVMAGFDGQAHALQRLGKHRRGASCLYVKRLADIDQAALSDLIAGSWAEMGVGEDGGRYWEEDAAWQGFRELMERALTVWDWGEAIVVLSLVVKPAVEEAVLRRLGEAARHNGDTLLGLITDAQLIDAARHRRWTAAFVAMTMETPGNLELIKGWLAKWEPLADRAIEAYCGAWPDVPNAAAAAKAATRDLRRGAGVCYL